MFSFTKLFTVLIVVTVIYNTQETKCGDEFNKLGPLGYNIIDNLLAKYYSKSDNSGLNDDPNNQLLQDQILDYAEYKVSYFICFFKYIKMHFKKINFIIIRIADPKPCQQSL